MPNRLLPLRMDAVTVLTKQNAKLIPAILLLCYGDLILFFGQCRWPKFSTILLSKENREIIGGLELMSWMLLLLGRKAYALKFLKVIIQVMLMISSLKLLESDKYLSSWSVLDIGTGNGLLLHELAKQGFSDLTGVDYSEGSIKLARTLADRDGFSNINLLD
ncbi:hypothetical protein POPTR_012G068600v4 [Populus trichocarpa]|uniref:Uncharacterized protein n=1 Tax=Populus trichocarpa TaxID=3694 RepID=A0ACC0S4V5_POPTR|nr:hypothetical protein POPTR_012G068600v4 [Populus trichocarpa]